MYPQILTIGSITIYSYGLLMAIGFVVAYFVTKRVSPLVGVDPEKITTVFILGSVTGYLGTRMMYVISHLDKTGFDPYLMAQAFTRGLVWYGGPLFALPVVIYYLRRTRISILDTLDVGAVAVSVGHAIGRLGCFCAGCCHGKPTDLPWGVAFPGGLIPSELRGIPIHPTQLYESFGLFVLFIVLLRVIRHRSFSGQVFLVYIFTYPILRSVIELFRGDLDRRYVIDGILSTSQFISIFVLIGAFLTYLYLRRRHADTP